MHTKILNIGTPSSRGGYKANNCSISSCVILVFGTDINFEEDIFGVNALLFSDILGYLILRNKWPFIIL